MAVAAQPISPFFWQGNQAVTKSELDRQKAIADALRNPQGYQPTGPWSLAGSLADEGVAAVRDARTSQAETAAQQSVADALAKGDYQGVIANDMATPQQSAVAQALWQQKQQENDPLRKLQIEQAQLNLEQDRNPAPEPPKPPTVTEQFDPATGRSQKVQWNSQTGAWEPLGGVEAPKEPLVTVNNGGEGAYDKTLNESLAKNYIDIGNQAQSAQTQLGTLDAMQQTLADPNFYSGTGGDVTLALKRAAVAMGADPAQVTSTETFNALSKQAALGAMGGSLGSGFSNADRDFVESQVPNLANTPQGNSALIGLQRKIAERKIQIAQFADQYASQNGGRLDAGFSTALAKWAEANPVFPKIDAKDGGKDFVVIDGVKIRPKS